MELQTEIAAGGLIAERIEQVVRNRTGGVIRELRVHVYDNSVVIEGRAPSYYSKQLATHAAFDVLNGETLTNDIEVHSLR